MPLYSQTVKNLISGVSQQPPVLRYPEQLEEQINGLSSEVGGLQKRPPTVHLATLGSCVTNSIKPLIHLIDRDKTEQYIVLHDGDTLKIWDMAGTKHDLIYEDVNSQNYIRSLNPHEDIVFLTIADYTFILNKQVETALIPSGVTPNYWDRQGLLVNIKSGQYGRTYSISFTTNKNVSEYVQYTTPDGSNASHTKNIDTNYIASQLAKPFMDCGRYDVSYTEGWLYIVPKDTTQTIVNFTVKDGYNNTAARGFIKHAQKYTDLPVTAPHNFCVEVAGTPDNKDSNYYIRFDDTTKCWKECARPNIVAWIDPDRMPHALVRQADGSFMIKAVEWGERTTGDDDSNPVPSFIGSKISDIFFYRNRLGFTAGEAVILSGTGDFFNFWMASATDVLDTDPVDLSVSHNKVSIIKHVVPYQEELLLFADKTQFALKADGVLTPKNATIVNTTEYDCSSNVRPVGVGRHLYFPVERAEYASINEYYILEEVSEIKTAQDITSHVPNYIPKGVYNIASSTSENILLVMTTGDVKSLYVYKFLFIDQQRVQSSWSKWTFEGEIIGGNFVNDTLYLVTRYNEMLYLEKILFTSNTEDFPEAEPYRALLDRKTVIKSVPKSAYNPTWGTTAIQLSSLYGLSYYLNAPVWGVVTSDGEYFEVVPNNAGVVYLEGDYSGKSLIVGKPYEFRAKFTEIMVKNTDNTGSIKADVEGRLQLKYVWVNCVNSGSCTAIVEHFDKGQYKTEMNPKRLGMATSKLNKVALMTGKFRFPVQSLSSNCSITIVSKFPTPLSLVGMGWEGNYIRRTRSI